MATAHFSQLFPDISLSIYRQAQQPNSPTAATARRLPYSPWLARNGLPPGATPGSLLLTRCSQSVCLASL